MTSYEVRSIQRDYCGPYWYCWRFPICVVNDFGELVPVRRSPWNECEAVDRD